MGPQKAGPPLASSPPPSRRASRGRRKGRDRAGTGLLEASGSGTSHTDRLVTQRPPLSRDPVEQPLPHLDAHKCSLKQLDAGRKRTATQVPRCHSAQRCSIHVAPQTAQEARRCQTH